MNRFRLPVYLRLSWWHRAHTMLALLIAMIAVAMTQAAEPTPAFETPTVEHVLTVKASIEAPLAMGKTPQGQRRVIPISGGTFEGRDMKGTIMPGGEAGSSCVRMASRN